MDISGINAVLSAIKNGNVGDVYVNAKHKELATLKNFQSKNMCNLHIVSDKFFKDKKIRQNILLRIKKSITNVVPNIEQWLQNTTTTSNLLVLIIDHIQDAQNFGAIIRSAALFAVDLIIMPYSRMAPINEFTVRSAAGTISSVPLCSVANLATSIEELKKHDFWIYALDMDGESIYTSGFSSRATCILGAESNGISHLLKQRSDVIVSIPTTNVIDSLNVSVSNGIVCYEYRKQFPLSL